jgi:hypothetical protein
MSDMTLQYKSLVIMHRTLSKNVNVCCAAVCYVSAVNNVLHTAVKNIAISSMAVMVST